MKKAFVVLALCVPFAAMLAFSIPTGRMAQASKPFEVADLLAVDTVELKADEATPVEFGFKMAAGNRMAVKLTPPDYPCNLIVAAYVPMGWADDPNNWDEACYLVFFGPGQEPGIELARAEVSAVEEFAWNLFDITPLGITIESGSFYFAVENKVDDNPGLALDGGYPPNHVSWMYTTFVGETDPRWAPFDNIDVGFPGGKLLGDSIDVMLRMLGEIQGTVVELKPDVETSVSLASIVASGGTINYSIAEAGGVEITLWDALGRAVRTLYTGYTDAGEHTLAWDGSDLAAGTYFIKLRTPYAVKTARVVLIP
jgi:hypothetical protein